ncbi:MAG: hypothetical protein IID40_00760 [Planctomycetes bacterium]|nr:hypothetical protein [Planctomycetota bacterium]
MQTERKNLGWRFWGRWVLATTIGWSVGIIAAFIVAHLIAPIVYIVIPHETNLVVGLCLGAGVGYMQRRFASNPITASGRWVLSTTMGMGIPFVVVVIAHEIWSGLPFGLVLIVTVGGLITGLLQLRNMRRHSRRSGWWVLASIVGWGLGWLVMGLGFAVGLLIGGALLGAVTGGAIVWLLQSPPSTEQDAGQALSTAARVSST